MTRTRNRHCRRRAFATLTAIGLVVVVAVAITALTALVANDAKRSIRQSDDAQVRQLLVAGEVSSRAWLVQRGQGQTNIPLPPDLASAGYSLRLESTPPENADTDIHIRVTADRPDGRAVSQSLRYTRAGDAWKLVSADLP